MACRLFIYLLYLFNNSTKSTSTSIHMLPIPQTRALGRRGEDAGKLGSLLRTSKQAVVIPGVASSIIYKATSNPVPKSEISPFATTRQGPSQDVSTAPQNSAQ
ncbi:hypothetical protein F5Y14DRAFT_142653 [Nemania sp. NC0429]|nr:hypothetical protein F5Y14DRAFT_142653 [Nemania sp. NC0429]